MIMCLFSLLSHSKSGKLSRNEVYAIGFLPLGPDSANDAKGHHPNCPKPISKIYFKLTSHGLF